MFEFDSPRAVSPEWRGSYTRRRLAATTEDNVTGQGACELVRTGAAVATPAVVEIAAARFRVFS